MRSQWASICDGGPCKIIAGCWPILALRGPGRAGACRQGDAAALDAPLPIKPMEPGHPIPAGRASVHRARCRLAMLGQLARWLGRGTSVGPACRCRAAARDGRPWRCARKQGTKEPLCCAVTFIQSFGSADKETWLASTFCALERVLRLWGLMATAKLRADF